MKNVLAIVVACAALLPAAPVNALLTATVRAEAAVARHVPMPLGSSILLVARR